MEDAYRDAKLAAKTGFVTGAIEAIFPGTTCVGSGAVNADVFMDKKANPLGFIVLVIMQ